MAAVGSLVFAASSFPVGAYHSGGYTLLFEKSGKFRYLKGDRLMVEGEYSTKGNDISFTDQRGVDACLGPGRDTGRYRWKGDEDALSFRKIDDSCDDRTRGLAGQEWKRAQVKP